MPPRPVLFPERQGPDYPSGAVTCIAWSVLQCYFHFTYEYEKLERAQEEGELRGSEKLPTQSELTSMFKNKLADPIREGVETRMGSRTMKDEDIIAETNEPSYHYIKNLAVETEAELLKKIGDVIAAPMPKVNGSGAT